jgi:hypothetical protein
MSWPMETRAWSPTWPGVGVPDPRHVSNVLRTEKQALHRDAWWQTSLHNFGIQEGTACSMVALRRASSASGARWARERRRASRLRARLNGRTAVPRGDPRPSGPSSRIRSDDTPPSAGWGTSRPVEAATRSMEPWNRGDCLVSGAVGLVMKRHAAFPHFAPLVHQVLHP